MRKIVSGLLIAATSLALAACNKPAEEDAPVVTEIVPTETVPVEDAVAPTEDAAATADEKGTDEGGTDGG